ncbi:MAG: hypothetical protein IPM01_18040 [Burkholderiaceae bacterium]|nr:hypothetical protein [Burkholderiaceae bacterium]
MDGVVSQAERPRPDEKGRQRLLDGDRVIGAQAHRQAPDQAHDGLVGSTAAQFIDESVRGRLHQSSHVAPRSRQLVEQQPAQDIRLAR